MQMDKHSAEVVVEELKKILIREKDRLDEEVHGKIERLIAELQGRKPTAPPHEPFDPDAQKLEHGFHFFKTNLFEKTQMAKQSAAAVVDGLKNIIIREQQGLDEEIQGKLERLIAEIQGTTRMPPPIEPFDPDAQRLEDGFGFFKTNLFDKDPKFFEELAKGQYPRFLVFACSDSRVSPPTILDFKLGEAFIGRNIANMVPEFDQLRHTEIGSVIEYAVKALKVPNILIIGHSHCGGIHRLMDLPDDGSNTDTYDFIDEWVKIGLPAKKKVLEKANDLPEEDKLRLLEKESVRNSMSNLLTYPYVRDGVVNGTITLRGGYYNFDDGTFEQWRMCTKPIPPMPPMPLSL